MIGNDIIDINETRQSSNWKRPGFIEKIFTKKEQHMIDTSVDPFTTVWHLWSMKESAYKVFIQAGGNKFFNPKRIECTLESFQNHHVIIDSITLKTNTSINSNYIFSTASIDNINIDTRIFPLSEKNSKFQSNYMHQQVIDDFSKSNSLNSIDLKIQKSQKGIPTLHYKNRALNTSLSITHHGNYGAYSILKN